MASKVSYQRLKQEVIFEDDDHHNKIKEKRSSDHDNQAIKMRSLPKISWFSKLKRRKFRIKICGFKKFFRIRRSVKVSRRSNSRSSFSCAKVLKRLKESQSHFGDLFSGNYLFMQVAPGSIKNNNTKCIAHHNYYQNNMFSNFSHSSTFMY
ncbi:unnamed protein product [Amaranthus hypochondriacus]